MAKTIEPNLDTQELHSFTIQRDVVAGVSVVKDKDGKVLYTSTDNSDCVRVAKAIRYASAAMSGSKDSDAVGRLIADVLNKNIPVPAPQESIDTTDD